MNTTYKELKHIIGMVGNKYIAVALEGSEATVRHLKMNELSNIGCIWMKNTTITLTDDEIAKTLLSIYDDRLLRLENAVIVDAFDRDDITTVCVEITCDGEMEVIATLFKDSWISAEVEEEC